MCGGVDPRPLFKELLGYVVVGVLAYALWTMWR